jgi:fumarate reductase subunit C
MLTLRLYMAQRLTALIMAPLTIGHLAVMIYAVQGGLSVAEILARTQGRWHGFYFMAVLYWRCRCMRRLAYASSFMNGLA